MAEAESTQGPEKRNDTPPQERDIQITIPRSQGGHRDPGEENRDDRVRRLTKDELVEEYHLALARPWPEMAKECKSQMFAHLSEEELRNETQRALTEGRWKDAHEFAGALYGRSLAPVKLDTPEWLVALQDRLHNLCFDFESVRRAHEGKPQHERLARMLRVLRALEASFGYSRESESGDDATLARLDEIAGPCVRKLADPLDIDPGELNRPQAAERLKTHWIVCLTHLKAPRPRKTLVEDARGRAELFASTLEDGQFTAFASFRDDLPRDWRSVERLNRVGLAIVDVVERHVLEQAQPDLDDAAEKLARIAMKTIGYPDPKAKSLFDAESKQVKRTT